MKQPYRALRTLSPSGASRNNRKYLRLLFLLIIGLAAVGDFLSLGIVRRTFIFYTNMEGAVVVEERMLRRSADHETDVRRYLEEALLGPLSPDTAPLFPRETRLHSFMYRDAVVYADLSESAALPVGEGGDVFRGLLTLNEGIRRNFSHTRDVKLFIGGNEVFFEEFRYIFANPADNIKTSP